MRMCESCGAELVRKHRVRRRRGRELTELESPSTFATRRFCDRKCKGAAQRRPEGPRTCPRCRASTDDFPPKGSYCRPCRNIIRREVAAAQPEREKEYARKKMRDERARRLAEDWVAARCLWTAYRLHVEAAGLRRLFDAQDGRCALTGRLLSVDDIHIDHILPRSRGGADELANLQWVCEAANRAKRALTDAEFVSLCRDVVQHSTTVSVAEWIGNRIVAYEEGLT